MSNSRYTRRAALAAMFAVGMHCATVSRARAETPAAVNAAAPTPWSGLSPEEQKVLSRYSESWNSLPAEQQQRLLRGTRRWLAMTPEQRAEGAGALFTLEGPDARAEGTGAQALAQVPRAAAGSAGAGARQLSPLQEAHARAAPAPARALAERHARRAAENAGAPPAAAGTPAAPRTSLTTEPSKAAGFGGIFFVFVPGLAQLIT